MNILIKFFSPFRSLYHLIWWCCACGHYSIALYYDYDTAGPQQAGHAMWRPWASSSSSSSLSSHSCIERGIGPTSGKNNKCRANIDGLDKVYGVRISYPGIPGDSFESFRSVAACCRTPQPVIKIFAPLCSHVCGCVCRWMDTRERGKLYPVDLNRIGAGEL